MVVHHSGKNKANGARGSSALRAATDTELEVEGNQVHMRKQRNGELVPAIGNPALLMESDVLRKAIDNAMKGAIKKAKARAKRLEGRERSRYIRSLIAEGQPTELPTPTYDAPAQRRVSVEL